MGARMGELASAGQLRASYARWALVTVPLILLAGIASGRLSGSGFGNPWFDMLAKPAAMPPGWVFALVWTILYTIMGLVLAMVLNARGARRRGIAIVLFFAQLALNLAWSPLFFAFHQLWPALVLIVLLIAVAIAATVAIARVRRIAGWLLVPYLAWACFARA